MNERKIFLLVLFISVSIVLFLDINSDYMYDKGDGIQHYLISLYSWKHPELLLDLWGKPLFTLISSPFSQLGTKGIILFQVICSIVTTLALYDIAKILRLSYVWVIPILIFFNPIYFAVINSGLTEICLDTFVVLSIRLVLMNKYGQSALLCSFLPFIRAEGMIVLTLIALVLIIRKKIKYLPLLFVGFIFYSLMGYFYNKKDILWLARYFMNVDASQNYEIGKYEWYHFFIHYKEIWGSVYIILLVVGLFISFYEIYQHIRQKDDLITNKLLVEKILLIHGSFWGILILHILMCSLPGFIANLGMFRYLVTIIPFSAYFALNGINGIDQQLLKIFPFPVSLPIRWVIIIFVIFFIVKSPFDYYYPFYPNNEEVVLSKVHSDLTKSSLKDKRYIYLSPVFSLISKLDPFDNNKVEMMWRLDTNRIRELPDSTVILWDSHFSLSDAKIKLEYLMNNPHLQIFKGYKYHDDMYKFEVWVFIKKTPSITPNNPPQLNNLEIVYDYDREKLQMIDSLSYDFDTFSIKEKEWISNEKSYSSNFSIKYEHNEFGPVFAKKFSSKKMMLLVLEFYIYPVDSINGLIPVIELHNRYGSKKEWIGLKIPEKIPLNTWYKCKLDKEIYRVKNQDIIVFYFWNSKKKFFFIDDLSIKYYALDE